MVKAKTRESQDDVRYMQQQSYRESRLSNDVTDTVVLYEVIRAMLMTYLPDSKKRKSLYDSSWLFRNTNEKRVRRNSFQKYLVIHFYVAKL